MYQMKIKLDNCAKKWCIHRLKFLKQNGNETSQKGIREDKQWLLILTYPQDECVHKTQ